MSSSDPLPNAATMVLRGVHVADLSQSVAGQFCTRLMADQGAAVMLFETPGRSSLRSVGPKAQGDDSSFLFRHLNSGKSSTNCPRDLLASVKTFEEQEGVSFDVIVVSEFAEEAELVGRFPNALIANVTDFPNSGPYASWRGSELVHQALSGSMFYNGSASGKPLYGVGHRAYYEAGLHLYIRIMAQLLVTPRANQSSVPLRVSVHECAASMEQNYTTQWAYSRTIPLRGEWNRPKGRVPCKDGWMVFFASRERLPQLFRAFECGDLEGDPRFFGDWSSFIENIAVACEYFAQGAASLTRAELLRRAVRDRLVLSPVRNLEDLFADEQLAARGYWPLVSDQAAKRYALGPLWRSDSCCTVRNDAAPALGERLRSWPRRSSVKHKRPQLSRRTNADSLWQTRTGGVGPLAGVRIVDLTSAWAGPMATRILAALGAQVIKVEGPDRYDGWRNHRTNPTHLESYPSRKPGERPFNRNAWFNTQNPGKKTIAIDLKRSEGIELALELVAQSDVVISNFSAGTMARMGLGYDILKKVNKDVVMVEMSGFGDTGPLREHRGLGQTMEAMAGITSLIGYADDGEPRGSGSAYLDPVGGLVGAAASLTGLVNRGRSGEGQRIEVPQREAAMHLIGELVLDAIENGALYRPRGNDTPDIFPHDAFRCRGDDEWIALATFDQSQWSSLCHALGLDELAADPTLSTAEGRRSRASEIYEKISKSLTNFDKAEIAELLQQNGVPAAPVQNGRDLYHDPQLRSRGWFTRLSHEDAGVHDYPGIPVEIAGGLSAPLTAAPRLGEHTYSILTEILNRNTEELKELERNKVVVCL